MQHSDNIQSVFNRYLDNKAGAEEIELLLKHFDAGTEEQVLRKMILEQLELPAEADQAWQYKLDETYQAVRYKMYNAPTVQHVHFLRKWGWAAAASIVILFSVGAYLWIGENSDPAPVVIGSAEILPGKEGAILTLADGSQVALDNLGDGLVAAQNGSQVMLQNGQISYGAAGTATAEMTYNTMTTPKGRQFQVTLPDGTKVWLNAASSIRYPTIFIGKERKVYVTGEAYFEVAQNVKQPFRVNINYKAEVNVLGTSFNISAYDNEKLVQTTLLEGSVRISSLLSQNSNGVIIKPGQQAQLAITDVSPDHPLHSPDQVRVVNVADIDKVMAWKNGLFYFEGVTLSEIMRQVERWYDIEVIYEKGVPDREFEGKMTRGVSLNGLLTALKKLGVYYRLEGRKLFILPGTTTK